jgi:hypothetical protein
MKSKIKILTVVFLFTTIFYYLFGWLWPNNLIYKIEYDVKFKGKNFTGSSIYSMNFSDTGGLPSGDAISIELPEARVLILSILPGAAVHFDDWNSHTTHKMDHWKLIMYTFRNLYVPRSSGDFVSRIYATRAKFPIDPRIVPNAYFINCKTNKIELVAKNQSELESIGITIGSANIAVTSNFSFSKNPFFDGECAKKNISPQLLRAAMIKRR